MQLIVLDTETYYGADYTLSSMTTEAYVRDPRFEVIGVGLLFPQTGQRTWMEEAQFRRFAAQYDWSRAAVLAHHAHFDGLILSHHYGVRPGYWLDTLSMARAIHGSAASNSLEALMLRYGIGVKGTEVINAKGKRRVDFTPEEWQRYGAYCLNDCDGAFGVYKKLAPLFPRSELDLIDITVRMFTEPVLVLDEPMLREYLQYETQRKEDLLTRSGIGKKELSSSDKFAELLRGYGVEPPVKLNPKGKTIYAFAKTDPGMQELLEDEDEEVRWLCEARIAIKSTGNQSRTERMLAMGAGGRPLPVYIKYGGAHTLRWSGADKVNWQNFERTNKKNPRKGTIRKAVRAPEGMRVIGGDASQIEARFNAWWSGEDWLVDAFRNKQDVYSLFGSEIYQRPIDRKKNPDDELPGHVAKTAVLGLGYHMGGLKFGAEVAKGANGAPPIVFTRDDLHKLRIDPRPFLANPKNVERIAAIPSRLPLSERLIHFAVANYIVDVYRAKNAKIAANWKFMGNIIKRMAAGEQGEFGKGGLLKLVEGGIQLPSGMVMHYHGLRETEDGFVYLAKRGSIARLHGGVLTENWVQACCRIIVSDAMRALHKEGLKIVSMEHDAIIGIAPEEEAPYWSQRLLQAIATPPVWAPGLPLDAEGGFGMTLAETK